MLALHQLAQRSDYVSGSGRDFWHRVRGGKEAVKALFDLKIKSGIWKTGSGSNQAEFLKKACREDPDAQPLYLLEILGGLCCLACPTWSIPSASDEGTMQIVERLAMIRTR